MVVEIAKGCTQCEWIVGLKNHELHRACKVNFVPVNAYIVAHYIPNNKLHFFFRRKKKTIIIIYD